MPVCILEPSRVISNSCSSCEGRSVGTELLGSHTNRPFDLCKQQVLSFFGCRGRAWGNSDTCCRLRPVRTLVRTIFKDFLIERCFHSTRDVPICHPLCRSH